MKEQTLNQWLAGWIPPTTIFGILQYLIMQSQGFVEVAKIDVGSLFGYLTLFNVGILLLWGCNRTKQIRA